jgi:hypothetical protein
VNKTAKGVEKLASNIANLPLSPRSSISVVPKEGGGGGGGESNHGKITRK